MARNEKKKAANAYIDAQARTAKARAALDAAMERYAGATSDEEAAREECARLEMPVGNPPEALELRAPAKGA
ncbi:MAG TPA: hypothetical protein VJP77_05780 [Planctomycetota bacterium]|nr:hypothetical protein [Planctomycetota bacterium]